MLYNVTIEYEDDIDPKGMQERTVVVREGHSKEFKKVCASLYQYFKVVKIETCDDGFMLDRMDGCGGGIYGVPNKKYWNSLKAQTKTIDGIIKWATSDQPKFNLEIMRSLAERLNNGKDLTERQVAMVNNIVDKFQLRDCGIRRVQYYDDPDNAPCW